MCPVSQAPRLSPGAVASPALAPPLARHGHTNTTRMEPGSTPSPQLLTHPGGCGGLKGSTGSGADGGWVSQMMGGPSPPPAPPAIHPHLWPLLWEQRRPQGADRGADSQAQSAPRAGPVTQCLPQISWERPFPLPWESLGGPASPSVVQGGVRGASLGLPSLPPGKYSQPLNLGFNKGLSVPCLPTAWPACHGSGVKAKRYGLAWGWSEPACLATLWTEGRHVVSSTSFPICKRPCEDINNVERA